MRDDQLRERFDRWARPLQATAPPPVMVLRRRARRHMVGRVTISGLAVTGAVVAIALSVFPRVGAVTAAPAAAPAAPRYAVTLRHSVGGQPAVVLDMITGKATGQVATPVTRSDFEWVAAASDDRTFALADQSQALVYRFYLLRLTASGTIGHLTLLNVTPLHGSQIYGMALTADASRLAVAWQNNPTSPVASHISVTTLASGATRTWTSTQGAAGALSWAGDRSLAFDWQDIARQARSGVRLLDTAATGTDPLGSRVLVPANFRKGALSAPGNPLIAQDGSTLFVTMASGSAGTKTVVASFAARTGRLTTVLTPAAPPSQILWYCGILWTDPHARHVLAQCGTSQVSVENGRSVRIHLRQLIPGSPVGQANSFAW